MSKRNIESPFLYSPADLSGNRDFWSQQQLQNMQRGNG